ncbi:MAG TPA: hypothetical protein VGI44_12805, partial [Acidimicrobiales bacterium]
MGDTDRVGVEHLQRVRAVETHKADAGVVDGYVQASVVLIDHTHGGLSGASSRSCLRFLVVDGAVTHDEGWLCSPDPTAGGPSSCADVVELGHIGLGE